MIKQRILLSTAVLVGSLGLAACGGGGSGGSSSTPPPADSPLLAVSASNYQAVGQATVSSALYLGGTGGVLTGAEVSDPRLLRHAVDLARQAVRDARIPPAQLTGAEVRQTVSCSQGGSLQISVNDVNNNGNVDIGDVITLDAQACKEDGSVMQGRISLSMQSLTGVFDSSNYSATLSMTLTAFSAAVGSDSAQGDGTLNVTLSQTPAGVSELTLSTPRLVLSGRIAGQPFSSTLTDTKLTLRVEPFNASQKASISYTGSLASSGLGDKQVLITTPQTLVSVGSEAYPSSGQLLVRGQANSAVRITAVSATQAKLELDADGDGNYETQVLKNWSELQ